MRRNILAGAIMASALFVAGVANAEPFYIVAPDGLTPAADPDKQTQDIYEFGINFTATSVYTTNGTDDSGWARTGPSTYTYAAAPNGNPVDLLDPVKDNGTGTVSSLLDQNANAIQLGNPSGNTDNEGYGATWGLNFSYTDLNGITVYEDNNSGIDDPLDPFFHILAKYAGTLAAPAGTINLYYANLTDPDRLVMKLKVIDSSASIGNIILTAAVDFTGADAIAQNMFFFADDTNWYNLWATGGALEMTIASRIDTNLDAQQNPQCNAQGVCTRTARLDGSVEFNRVPEPGVLALLGIGLAGVGMSRRRKSAA